MTPARPHLRRSLLANDGFTLIELLVAMLVGTVVTGAAFSFLIFTTEDVSHITARVGVDQNARIALGRIVSELHSACVAPSVSPILEKSTKSTLVFVSQAGESAALSTVEKHEIIFTAPSGSSEGTLIEKSYPSTGGSAPNYTWSTTAKTTKLLTGVKETVYGSEAKPVFRYYRYYQAGDTLPAGDLTLPYGEINNSFTPAEPLTSAEALYIAKVTVAFTLAPEGKEAISFNKDRPVPLEDSVVFRLAPASEAAGNLPCSEKT